ncbi:MAG: ribonuclease P protein component [Patescibacteria group bacterium]
MLPKKYSLSKDKDFQNVYKKGKILFSPFFNVKFLPRTKDKVNPDTKDFGVRVNKNSQKKVKYNEKFDLKNKNKALVRGLPNNLENSRFGIVISTKISKKAVVRNKSKRQIRAVIHKNLANIEKGFDIVILTKPAVTVTDFQKIEQTLVFLLTKGGIYHKN